MSAVSQTPASLHSAATAAALGFWQIVPHSQTLTPDAEACRILGVAGPIDFETWLATVHPDDASRLRDALLESQTGQSPIEVEYRVNSAVARWIYLKGSAENGIAFDSTSRHRVLFPIVESSEHFRLIVEHAREGVWIVDSEGKTAYANPEMAAMLRCDLKDLIGRPALDFVFEDELPRAFEERDRRNLNSEAQRIDFRYRRADGTELWAQVNSSILPGPEDCPRLVLGVFADRTAEKEDERQRELILNRLAAETELLERIIETIPVMLIINDPATGSIRINREFTRVLGWTIEDAQAGTLLDVCYPDPVERARALDYMRSLVSGWRDFQVTARNGSMVKSSWANIRLSDNRIVGIGIDLRERLSAEEELRESEFRLKLALDAMELGTFDYDLITRQVMWSERTRRCFGLSPEAPITFDTLWQAIPPEEIPVIQQAVEHATASGSGRYYVEHRATGFEDGIERWIAAWGRVLFDSAGAPIRYTGLNLDITERKRAEKAIAETRARQEILSEVVTRLLTTENPQGIIDDLVAKVLCKTGADVFFNFLLDHHTGKLKLNSSTGLSDTTVKAAQYLELGQAICGMVAQEAASRNLSDISSSTDERSEVLRRERVEAYSCHPLLGAGQVLGTLGFGSRSKSAFSEEDIKLFEAVAGYVAIALDRLHAREAIEESQERYRAIASNIPDGCVWVVDRDFRFIAIEGPLVSQLSSRGAKMLGQKLTDVAPPGLADLGVKNFTRAFEGKTTFAELEVNGRVLQSQVVPIRDAAGNVTAAMALAFDITSRKEAENALLESERRERARAAELEAIMDAVPAATWVAHDPECRHITANRFGYDVLRAMPGINISKTAAPAEVPTNFRVYRGGVEVAPEDLPVQVAARTGKPVLDSDLEIHYTDGPPRYLFGNAMPLLDAAGNPAGAVGAFIDMTERKRVEDELRQTQKLESIGVLAGGVAHDFNNMLTGVLGNASLALLDAPPRIADKLNRIAEAAERAAGLTRQLLAYAGKGQFMLTDVDVARIIRSSTELMRISITRNIELVTDAVPKSLPVIRADASQIQQVVMNLVINAAEAIGPTQPGTVTVSAGVQQANKGGRQSVFLHVTDTGCGIAEETRKKIFDPFFTTKFTGRGLGLAAVQGIVRSLKGTIQVESQAGFGSAFTVIFPCPENAEPSQETRADSFPASAASGLTVLVADDEPVICEIAQAALEKFGCRVLLASNGQQAIDSVLANPEVDVILLDVVMPVLGGLDAAVEIRRLKPYAAILLTSGFTREETSRMGILPADIPFLQKPFSVQQLAAAIASALPVR